MCFRLWQDGKFVEIDEPEELASRVRQTLKYYKDQMEMAEQKAAKTRNEVAAEIINEHDDENRDLKQRLRFSIAKVYSEPELEAYESFLTRHLVCRQTKSTGGAMPWIMQHGTGIGVTTRLRCPVCGEEKDITDTSIW